MKNTVDGTDLMVRVFASCGFIIKPFILLSTAINSSCEEKCHLEEYKSHLTTPPKLIILIDFITCADLPQIEQKSNIQVVT